MPDKRKNLSTAKSEINLLLFIKTENSDVYIHDKAGNIHT